MLLLANARKLSRDAMVFLVIVAAASIFTPSIYAQTFQVIHYFTPQAFGPMDGLVADATGNLYGSLAAGDDGGAVFRMQRHNSSWIYTPLYSFKGGADGASPVATPVFGPDGALYGTTLNGGSDLNCPGGCGTVYKLFPPATACPTPLCGWSDKVLYAFYASASPDGFYPESRVSFDASGNLYGSTYDGGGNPPPDPNMGAIFQLSPSNGVWNENIILTFSGMGTGNNPTTGVILDSSGNLYGTNASMYICGFHQACGAVFELQYPNLQFLFIYPFDQTGDGTQPNGAPIWDAEGNMYGTTSQDSLDGSNGPTIWELSPMNGSWVRTNLYTWPVGALGGKGSLTMDAGGNLYGVQSPAYGSGNGSVFKVTKSDGAWTYSTLHVFQDADGSYPNGSLVGDTQGNVFGTTATGGHSAPECPSGCGVVYEISQQ